VHSAIQLIQSEEQTRDWLNALSKVTDRNSVHGLVAGRACRLLLEQRTIDANEAARRVGLALSRASGAAEAANWAEGFLKGSGLLLIHNDSLWSVIDDWITGLSTEGFSEILPLLRRTFSLFEPAERRQMGEKVASAEGKAGKPRNRKEALSSDLDLTRADAVLPVLTQILGLEQ
jgi:hypothetical protein